MRVVEQLFVHALLGTTTILWMTCDDWEATEGHVRDGNVERVVAERSVLQANAVHDGPRVRRFEQAGGQGVQRPQGRRCTRLRCLDRRSAARERLRAAVQPEHAHREPGRCGVHRCGLPGLDARCGIQGHIRETPGWSRLPWWWG